MRWSILQKIIHHLQKEHSCPQCRSPFDLNHFHILSISNDSRIDLKSECPKCGAVSRLQIGICTNEKLPKKNSKQLLSSDYFVQVHHDLKSFRGRNIRDLFKNSPQ